MSMIWDEDAVLCQEKLDKLKAAYPSKRLVLINWERK